MKVSCTRFEDGHVIPVRYTKDGEDHSPPLQWSEVPESARELAVIFENVTPETRELEVHWFAYGIPPDRRGLPEGFKHEADPESPADVLQGTNSRGNVGYDGPLGTAGRTLRYRFTLYALDKPLQLPAGASKEEFFRKASGHVVEEAELLAEYERKGA